MSYHISPASTSEVTVKFLIFLHCADECFALVCSWLARTDPKDVARVESKTVIVTKNQRDTIPIPAGGAKSQLGSWMSEADWQKAREERFPNCMAGTLDKSQLHKSNTNQTLWLLSQY